MPTPTVSGTSCAVNEFSPTLFPEVRAVPGWPDYFASTDGKVYSTKSGSILKELVPSKSGGADADYLYVTLCRDAEQRRIGVHQVVALTFLPPPEVIDGKLQNVVRHRNNDTRNNAAGNLLWGTQKQNLADRVAAGTMTWGERNGQTKLTDSAIADIRRRRAAGESCHSIAKDYPVGRSQVHRIGLGERWNHMEAPCAPRQRRSRKDSHACAVEATG